MSLKVSVDRQQLNAFCQANGINKLAVFGSAVREDFDPARSDVDVLLAFAAGQAPGMFKFVRLADELERLFGRRVDLVTYESLHPLLREQILAEAEVQYDQAG
jgi:hypothetical protein